MPRASKKLSCLEYFIRDITTVVLSRLYLKKNQFSKHIRVTYVIYVYSHIRNNLST